MTISPDAMLMNSIAYGLGGFVIGVLLKSVIDRMASRDTILGRLDAMDRLIDSLDDDVSELRRRCGPDEAPCRPGCLCRFDPPSDDDVAAAMDMLSEDDPTAEIYRGTRVERGNLA